MLWTSLQSSTQSLVHSNGWGGSGSPLSWSGTTMGEYKEMCFTTSLARR